MERMIGRISGALIDADTLSEEDADVFAYGLELILSTLTSAGVLLLLSIFLGMFFETAAILLIFAVLQTTGGGFHASTRTKCSLTMLCTWATCMLLIQHLSTASCIAIISIGLSSIFYHAPVENENAPMSSTKREKMKQLVLKEAVLFSLVACALLHYLPQIGYAFTLAVGLSGMSMFAASTISKREQSTKPIR